MWRDPQLDGEGLLKTSLAGRQQQGCGRVTKFR